MNFLKQANTAIKSAKELEKNLASVGITKDKFLGKKQQTPAGTPGANGAPPNATTAAGTPPVNTYGAPPTNTYGAPPTNTYQQPTGTYGAPPGQEHAYQQPGQQPYGVQQTPNYGGSPGAPTYGQPPANTYDAHSSQPAYGGAPTGTYFTPPVNTYGAPIVSPGEVPPQIRQSYEARKPEFEALLASIKEQAWIAALDAAAKNTHADHQAAKTASPDYVLDALNRLQEHIKKFEK